MQSQVRKIIIKLQHLKPERLAEVNDFIDFLQSREQEQQLRRDFSQVSNKAFHKVRDNEDDAIYDSL
jgi:hypothetical protein